MSIKDKLMIVGLTVMFAGSFFAALYLCGISLQVM